MLRVINGLGAVTGCLSLVVCAYQAGASKPVADRVEAREFVLIGSDGQPVGVFGLVDTGGYGIQFHAPQADGTGKVTCRLRVLPTGAQFVLEDDQGGIDLSTGGGASVILGSGAWSKDSLRVHIGASKERGLIQIYEPAESDDPLVGKYSEEVWRAPQ